MLRDSRLVPDIEMVEVLIHFTALHRGSREKSFKLRMAFGISCVSVGTACCQFGSSLQVSCYIVQAGSTRLAPVSIDPLTASSPLPFSTPANGSTHRESRVGRSHKRTPVKNRYSKLKALGSVHIKIIPLELVKTHHISLLRCSYPIQ